MLKSQDLLARLNQLWQDGRAPPYIPAHHAEDLPASLSGLDPGELKGRSVLDVGCGIGLRCFEAIEMGATRVVGVDVNPERVLQARALARALGYDADFHLAEAGQELPEDRFDAVICFNILHRDTEPAMLLQSLGARTKESLIVESPDADHPMTDHYLGGRLSWWQRRLLRRLPVLAVGRNGPDFASPEYRYFVSRRALERLLLHHQGVFADVRFADARPGYYRAVARRRRIGHLLLVAGASGAGKSTFIEHVRRGTLPRGIADRVEVEPFRLAPVVNAFEVANHRSAEAERLVLHYDLNRIHRQPARRLRGDVSLQLVDCAERLTLITLWADPRAVAHRRLQRTRSDESSERHREQQRRDLQAGSPEMVRSLYREWFEYCREWPAAHHVVDSSGEYRVLTEEAMREGILQG